MSNVKWSLPESSTHVVERSSNPIPIHSVPSVKMECIKRQRLDRHTTKKSKIAKRTTNDCIKTHTAGHKGGQNTLESLLPTTTRLSRELKRLVDTLSGSDPMTCRTQRQLHNDMWLSQLGRPLVASDLIESDSDDELSDSY